MARAHRHRSESATASGCPRAPTIRRSRGHPDVHTGQPPSRRSLVSCRAVPPPLGITQKSPFGPSVARKYATADPSGENAGVIGTGVDRRLDAVDLLDAGSVGGCGPQSPSILEDDARTVARDTWIGAAFGDACWCAAGGRGGPHPLTREREENPIAGEPSRPARTDLPSGDLNRCALGHCAAPRSASHRLSPDLRRRCAADRVNSWAPDEGGRWRRSNVVRRAAAR